MEQSDTEALLLSYEEMKGLLKREQKQTQESYDDSMTTSKRDTGPFCKIHTTSALVCMHCVGVKGGRAKTEAKQAASRANSLLGGRPKNLRGGRPKKQKLTS